MHRRQPFGLDLAKALGGERAERHRREGRPEARRADLGDRLAERLGHDGEARHVGGLALVGRHAERGVALQVLDRDEAFAMREAHVLGRHVVLEVDEGLALGAVISNTGAGADRAPAPLDFGAAPGATGSPLAAAAAGCMAFGERFGGGESAVEGAGADPVLRRLAAAGRPAAARPSSALPPAWLARWIAGDQPPDTSRQSAAMLRGVAASSAPRRAVEALHLDAGQRLAAFGADHGVAGRNSAPAVDAARRAPRPRSSARTSTMATISAPAVLQRARRRDRRRHCW